MDNIVSIVGFDSAWTDSLKATGALSIIRHSQGASRLHLEPTLTSFAEALAIIKEERAQVAKCVVALDQPTIVPNIGGSRPVDKVAGSLISWIGGGVQPANRSKVGMFDDDAPIWKFKGELKANEDPEQARFADEGVYLLEVFPALALASVEPEFCRRLGAPKYNPAVRKRFQLVAWQSVLRVLLELASSYTLQSFDGWCETMRQEMSPRKSDQDKVDAMICALVGLQWLRAPRAQSMMIGDLESGYMIAPAPGGIHERLVKAAQLRGVRYS
ncbi:DUF429 domain-containing protein [Rhizobium ruizarguesonis]|nr:DUF429 domain-containing protein [Rhizobium ruizarguesonis]